VQLKDRSIPFDAPAVEVSRVSRRFGPTDALNEVSLAVRAGEVHALLGPNGAGKTTLMRILTGLLYPEAGEVYVDGRTPRAGHREYRKSFGFVPSGDRSFYLRISGLENLVFFGRLFGLRRAEAVRRARECLADVGLADAARKAVGLYSHGMQKRLSVARALLMNPRVLFIDEATHDLDPEGARRVRELVAGQSARGTAVLWATQRLEEIQGFAHRVTVLDHGRIRFTGTVPQLVATFTTRSYVLQLGGSTDTDHILGVARNALGAMGTVDLNDETDPDHYLVALRDDVVLGRAIAALVAAGIDVLACREEHPGVENAFLRLTGGETR
jgi:ABC-2 type transport system ATP-binding protein